MRAGEREGKYHLGMFSGMPIGDCAIVNVCEKWRRKGTCRMCRVGVRRSRAACGATNLIIQPVLPRCRWKSRSYTQHFCFQISHLLVVTVIGLKKLTDAMRSAEITAHARLSIRSGATRVTHGVLRQLQLASIPPLQLHEQERRDGSLTHGPRTHGSRHARHGSRREVQHERTLFPPLDLHLLHPQTAPLLPTTT
jgi:hypothetical protein